MPGDNKSDIRQAEFYKKFAKSEANKFDNRLFWFTGGVAALSLGYFQATDTLHKDLVLILGYAALLMSIILMLVGLLLSSRTSNNLAIWYGEKAKRESAYSPKQIEKKICNYDSKERALMAVNILALGSTIIGVFLIVVYMFSTK